MQKEQSKEARIDWMRRRISEFKDLKDEKMVMEKLG